MNMYTETIDKNNFVLDPFYTFLRTTSSKPLQTNLLQLYGYYFSSLISNFPHCLFIVS